MFVDASAIIAIMAAEADGESLAAALDAARSQRPITSVLAVGEAAKGLFRKKNTPIGEAEARVLDFLEIADIQLVSVSHRELTAGLQTFDRCGRHRSFDGDRNSALTLADCFHYAVTKSHRADPDQGRWFCTNRCRNRRHRTLMFGSISQRLMCDVTNLPSDSMGFSVT